MLMETLAGEEAPVYLLKKEKRGLNKKHSAVSLFFKSCSGLLVSPRQKAPLCLVCVPWFDNQGRRRSDAMIAQQRALASARRLGACPIAPYVEEICQDPEGWERYLHALTLRCDSIWLVTMEGCEEHPDTQKVLTWARRHAIQIHRWAA